MKRENHGRLDVATEREWLARSIRYRREALGLRQRDLSEILDTVGAPMSQGVLAKLENGDRDLDVLELVAVCIALGTTPAGLLFPVDDDDLWVTDVVPDWVVMPSGARLMSAAVAELFDGNPLTGTTAAAWTKRVDVGGIDLEAVLDVQARLAADPDAVAVANVLGVDPDVVSEVVASHAAELSGWAGTRRKRWTCRELVDEGVAAYYREHGTPDAFTPNAVRRIRAARVRDLADAIEPLLDGER